MLDLQGNLISVFSNTSVLNLENIKNGIYLLRIHSDKGISTQKLIILK
ncbi:T9SS type A sorting domain-containing protein [Pseudomonas sp. Kh7]